MENRTLPPQTKRYTFSEIPVSTEDSPKTKACPFCAEIIQAAAVKCRFCNEFLNTDKAKAIEAEKNGESYNNILFRATPSLFGLAETFVKAVIIIALCIVVLKFVTSTSLTHLNIPKNNAEMISRYIDIAAEGIIFITIVVFALKAIWLKKTYYEVGPDRIEFGRGIFDRKVDNLDMFRITDLKLRRTIPDFLFGIGTVVLITNDKGHPEFIFKKIRNSRKLYDILKQYSLKADQKQGVLHIE